MEYEKFVLVCEKHINSIIEVLLSFVSLKFCVSVKYKSIRGAKVLSKVIYDIILLSQKYR